MRLYYGTHFGRLWQGKCTHSTNHENTLPHCTRSTSHQHVSQTLCFGPSASCEAAPQAQALQHRPAFSFVLCTILAQVPKWPESKILSHPPSLVALSRVSRGRVLAQHRAVSIALVSHLGQQLLAARHQAWGAWRPGMAPPGSAGPSLGLSTALLASLR